MPLTKQTVLLVMTSLVIAGCGSDESSEESRTPLATNEASKPRLPKEPDPSKTVHKIGQGIELDATTTTDEGERAELRLSVRPIRVTDPAANSLTSADAIEQGTRWVRVEVQIENKGNDSYNMAQGPWTVLDENGEEAFNNLSSAPWRALGNSRLLPGDSRRGSVAFVVKRGHDLDELRWSPIVGLDPTYRWELDE